MAAHWEVLMHRVKEIRGKSNALLFDRAKLLVEIWNDGDYLAFHNGSVDKAESFLDAELGDFGLGFFDVKAMLESFPRRVEWSEGKLREMLATALAKADEARRSRAPETAAARPRVTRKEVEAVEAEKVKAVQRGDYLESEVESLRRKNDELTAENRRLTAELARAEGRISELERFATREPVAA